MHTVTFAGNALAKTSVVQWIARFLDWTQLQRCRVCGASLGNSRVVLVKGVGAMWRADLQCHDCRAMLSTDVDEAA